MSKKKRINRLEKNLISAYREIPIPKPGDAWQQKVMYSSLRTSVQELAVKMPQLVGAHVIGFAGTAAVLAIALLIYFFATFDATSVDSSFAILANPFAFLGI